ncbi:DUF6915 family protein [Yinghuangia aomiensis]
MNSWHHAQASARKWGGEPELYLPVHEFIDSSKRIIGDVRHRSLYHHTEGVWLCQRIFGVTLDIPRQHSTTQVPVRLIAEQHVLEDLGWLPRPRTTSTACRSTRGCPAPSAKPSPSPTCSSTTLETRSERPAEELPRHPRHRPHQPRLHPR